MAETLDKQEEIDEAYARFRGMVTLTAVEDGGGHDFDKGEARQLAIRILDSPTPPTAIQEWISANWVCLFDNDALEQLEEQPIAELKRFVEI
jgi:hypothetical protein